MSENRCGECQKFDAIHEMCPIFTIEQTIGKYYLKRLPESPACTSEFTRHPGIKPIPCSIKVEGFAVQHLTDWAESKDLDYQRD